MKAMYHDLFARNFNLPCCAVARVVCRVDVLTRKLATCDLLESPHVRRPCARGVQLCVSGNNMAGYFVFMFSSLLLATVLASTPSGEDYQGKLSRAYASPLNVDPKLDCAVKELAWEYGKKLQPQVSDCCIKQHRNYLSSKTSGRCTSYLLVDF